MPKERKPKQFKVWVHASWVGPNLREYGEAPIYRTRSAAPGGGVLVRATLTLTDKPAAKRKTR